jgi:hypothetical protein
LLPKRFDADHPMPKSKVSCIWSSDEQWLDSLDISSVERVSQSGALLHQPLFVRGAGKSDGVVLTDDPSRDRDLPSRDLDNAALSSVS